MRSQPSSAKAGRQDGRAQFKTILWLAILVGLIYVSIKMLPHYIDNYSLEDTMKVEARFAAVQRRSDEEIRTNVFRRVQELGLPIRRDDIRIQRMGYNTRIETQYTIEVNLLGYVWKLNFKPRVDSQSL